ncbi:MAG: biotin--[acetyl-CoA-carboxylase] ligase [Candidatus Nealsonbacteria bacterium]|nr:MAG: biotin--[acetyl-CoA-carboxylase] ligase [Candidatus Nealsonbacteria bacterium]
MKFKKYKRISSTNALAKKVKHEPWLVIWAEEQTAGYGRKKDYWFSPKGGLYFSVVLPKSTIDDLQTLTILAAFVVAKVMKENFNVEPMIKLPNDVYLNQKKIAGILTETVVGTNVKFSIMGFGLNTNIDKFPKDLENIATSLKIELGKKVDNEKILKQIIEEIKNQLRTISE